MRDLNQYVGRRVLVFTSSMTFDGTLERVGRDTITLGTAEAVSDSGDRRPVDGLAVVPVLQLDWMQVP